MTDLGGNRFFAQRQNIIVLTVVKVDLLHRTGLMHYEHGMHVYWNRAVFYCDYNAPRHWGGALSYAAIRPSVCLSVGAT